jgi:hypothetical protein
VVDTHKMKMGIGAIIRDNIGEVMTTLSKSKDYIIALDVVKVTMVLMATKFNSELVFYESGPRR